MKVIRTPSYIYEMYKSWTGGAWWSLKFFNSYTFYGVSEDLYLLHTLHHYLIERDWCWRRWRRLGNNGSTWWGLRRLTRMSANPCSWTWGWVCNDKATTFTNARLSSTTDICNHLLICTCFCKQQLLLSCTFFSCPGQLNRWPCHWVSQSVSQSDFWFQRH